MSLAGTLCFPLAQTSFLLRQGATPKPDSFALVCCTLFWQFIFLSEALMASSRWGGTRVSPKRPRHPQRGWDPRGLCLATGQPALSGLCDSTHSLFFKGSGNGS